MPAVPPEKQPVIGYSVRVRRTTWKMVWKKGNFLVLTEMIRTVSALNKGTLLLVNISGDWINS